MKPSLIILGIITTFIVSWLGRGIYDEVFMNNNQFHVVNNSSVSADIKVQFPSGEEQSFKLEVGASSNFHVANTGEGGVSVFVNGKPRHPDSYVTSMNPPTVLIVNNETTLYSPIFYTTKQNKANKSQ